ncbi:MAG: protein involved in polysaccharide export with SLBB domain, partial [Psychroserpens sp.]
MSFKNVLVFITLIIVFSVSVHAQTPGGMNIEELTDTEVAEMWKQAQEQGFTIDQFKTLAIARGVPSSQVNVLITRINTLGSSPTDASVSGGEESNTENNSLEIVIDPTQDGLTGGESMSEGEIKIDITKSRIFGVDFFNNPNISFAPNLNLATPSNYELGPGDKLVINLWGAAENTYNKEVDRVGAIRLEGLGPIYLSGLTMEEANNKIEGKLKTIYSGISAPNRSPYKINLDVSMASVRTVSVNIIGEVKVPGTYSLSSLSTVLNALYAAGGPTEEGTFRSVKLVRNGHDVTYFDVYKYLMEGSQEGNRTLQDQDVIIVSPYLSRITIGGAVKKPGSFELKPNEKLKDLLRFVSGFKSDAYRERLILERINGDRMLIKEILIANAENETLNDGDLLRVNKIINKFENRIQIIGAVYRPGSYEYSEGIMLLDLINKSAGVREEAFLDRGLIFSTVDGVTKTSESFSVTNVLQGTENVILKANDVVTIYNKYDLKEEYTLSIDGAVNNPSSFPYIENITIEDLVIMAGGFKDAADFGVIDVFRKIKDSEFETLSKTYKLASDGKLTIDGNEVFKLEPNDRVSVRYLKGYSEQKRVAVNGEINFPGNYTIEMKNERISDLVDR